MSSYDITSVASLFSSVALVAVILKRALRGCVNV